jgi:hypothetical protein
MPRGYRSVILAAFVWLILSGAKPPAEQPKSPASDQRAAQTVTPRPTPTPANPQGPPEPPFAAYPGYDPDPCYHAEKHDAADLCAQWRAALAAEKASREARRATTWAAIGTGLSAAAIFGLVFTILQGQKGLRLAREANRSAMRENARNTRRAVAGAEDAAETLKAAQGTAAATAELVAATKASLLIHRPMMVFESLRPVTNVPNLPDRLLTLSLTMKNYGQTPALIKSVGYTVMLTPRFGEITLNLDFGKPNSEVVPADEPFRVFDKVFSREESDLFGAQLKDAFIYVRVTYVDVFSNPSAAVLRETQVAYKVVSHGEVEINGVRCWDHTRYLLSEYTHFT